MSTRQSSSTKILCQDAWQHEGVQATVLSFISFESPVSECLAGLSHRWKVIAGEGSRAGALLSICRNLPRTLRYFLLEILILLRRRYSAAAAAPCAIPVSGSTGACCPQGWQDHFPNDATSAQKFSRTFSCGDQGAARKRSVYKPDRCE